jgi:uncharacterized secreted protein with C-terminal beta-propeller domain
MVSRNRCSRMFAILITVIAVVAPAFAQVRPSPSPRRPARRVQPNRLPPVQSSSLQKISSCADLQSYLVDVAVETLLEQRYSWRFLLPWDGGAAEGRNSSDVPSDYSTTNNQVQGVDEMDIVKTNGTHLYAVEGNSLHILRAWPAEATAELASVRTQDHARGLFLRGNRVLVASQQWSWDGFFRPSSDMTRFELLDVSDPEAPQVLRTVDVEGWLVDARLIDGDLYAVIRSHTEFPEKLWGLVWNNEIGLPDLPWDATDAERERILAEARAILTPLVVDILTETPIDAMLPQMRDHSPDDPDAPATALVDCGSLYRPAHTSSWAVLSVLHLDLDNDGPSSAVGLLADGWTVYASATNLYVAQSSDWWWWGWGNHDMSTSIHKFELDPAAPEPVTYAASGKVDGWILDQFALSEYDGYLRVATTEFDWWWGTTSEEEQASSVYVLSDDGAGKLGVVGHVGGLGPGERIFAVRFLGDKGYVVTFEQVDPLYTLDLSDPTHPTAVGELEVTGFSSYLHPIGNDRLLAVGMEADEEGRVLGLAVSVFDVKDLADPQLVHRYLIEGDEDAWSWSEALSDHHAFTYHNQILSIPAYISGREQRFSGLIVLEVEPGSGIFELGRVDHRGLGDSEYEAWMRRSVFIDGALYSLSSAGVKVNSLDDLEVELAAVPFGE